MSWDIQRPDLETLDRSATGRAASLSRVYSHATGLAAASEAWYASHRRPKRIWGQGLRVSALVLGTVAALLPILSQIYSEPGGEPAIAPGWASVALVVAAGMVALDRYFGYSNAWMRYMTTGMHIARLGRTSSSGGTRRSRACRTRRRTRSSRPCSRSRASSSQTYISE